MRRGLVTCEQEQEHHYNHLFAAYRRTLLLDLDQLREQALTTNRAGVLQAGCKQRLIATRVGTMRRKTRALEALVARFAQAMNFGRSASGRPSSSQITESGSARAYRATRSAVLACAKSSSARWSAIAQMRGAMSRTARRRKASSTIPRNLL